MVRELDMRAEQVGLILSQVDLALTRIIGKTHLYPPGFLCWICECCSRLEGGPEGAPEPAQF